jgi:hypothetical protein
MWINLSALSLVLSVQDFARMCLEPRLRQAFVNFLEN